MQEEGEQFALHSPERLWALVTFDSGPSHEGLTDYTIRMNYTTVPRTWLSVNKWSHHLKVSDISFDMSAGDRQATRPTTPAMRCTRQMAAASSCEEHGVGAEQIMACKGHSFVDRNPTAEYLIRRCTTRNTGHPASSASR